MTRFCTILCLFALGCGGEKDQPTTTDSGTTDSAGSTPTTETAAETSDTGPTTYVAPIDCASLPTPPLSIETVPEARGYHGLVLTDNGTIIGSDGSSLIESERTGNASVFRPNIGYTEQMSRDEIGDLFVLQAVGITHVTYPQGATNNLANIPGLPAYGLVTGPDGHFYVANQSTIFRIDSQTGERTDLLSQNNLRPKVLQFSVNNDALYFGTLYKGGNVYRLPLDADLNPTADAVLIGATPGSYHDGLAVDICGNLYIAEFNTRGMYKMTPDGVTTTVIRDTAENYGHGTLFGHGLGGFREDALYVPQPYNNNTVAEMVLGVPGRLYQGPVINQPL